MMEALGIQCVGERFDDMVLANDLLEFLRPPFSGQHHGSGTCHGICGPRGQFIGRKQSVRHGVVSIRLG